jgi:hypothetical protein
MGHTKKKNWRRRKKKSSAFITTVDYVYSRTLKGHWKKIKMNISYLPRFPPPPQPQSFPTGGGQGTIEHNKQTVWQAIPQTWKKTKML